MTEPTREQLDNLLDHAHKRRLGPAEVDRIRAGFDALRQQLALSQDGASQRETLLTEARDALEEHGGHGDAWPDIVAPILELAGERDRLAGAVQRVRDLHRPEELVDPSGVECSGCGDSPYHIDYGVTWPCPTIAALDAQPEPAADTRPLTRRIFTYPGDGRSGTPDPAPVMHGINPDSLLTVVDEAVPAADTETTNPPKPMPFAEDAQRYMAASEEEMAVIRRLSVADLAGGDPAFSVDAKAARDANQAFLEEAALSTDLPASARIHHEPTADPDHQEPS
ncbi:hypothetical protein ACIBSV_46975 [Embleya sp. NPDC050154]|uniref:hypothetical protein n=1 Tax=Embleya sp. NPDC050154 TaxID=3363988 RepID=UPI0037BBB209